MVLAMDVIRNCSTESYIFGPGSDGEKKAAGDGEVEDLRQGLARAGLPPAPKL